MGRKEAVVTSGDHLPLSATFCPWPSRIEEKRSWQPLGWCPSVARTRLPVWAGRPLRAGLRRPGTAGHPGPDGDAWATEGVDDVPPHGPASSLRSAPTVQLFRSVGPRKPGYLPRDQFFGLGPLLKVLGPVQGPWWPNIAKKPSSLFLLRTSCCQRPSSLRRSPAGTRLSGPARPPASQAGTRRAARLALHGAADAASGPPPASDPPTPSRQTSRRREQNHE